MKIVAWLILAFIALTALTGGILASRTIFNNLAPYAAFGSDAVRDNIYVIEDQRRFIVFSNRPSERVPRGKFVWLNLLSIVIFLAISWAIFRILLRASMSAAGKLSDELHSVLHRLLSKDGSARCD